MVPRLNELIKISEFLREIDSDLINWNQAEIVFHVTPTTVKRLNEDIYYRNNQEGEPLTAPDELEVTIGGIKFRYTSIE